jgi:predicted enzyme related to lactoylglutathione lyase
VKENIMSEDWARPVVYFEIQARDADVLSHFYGELFNWNIGDGFIRQIPTGIGGPENGIGGHIRSGNRPGVTLYIQVKDLAVSLARAVSLGGAITMERFDIPDGASLAGITDPEGNAVTLVQQ